MDSSINLSTIALGVGWFAVFLFSTTFHEASHALVSYLLGDPTAHEGGQVSLNPLPHIRREPFGMVVLPILSFVLSGFDFMIGWASTPFNPAWANQYPRRAGLMALAGPTANLILVIVAGLIMRWGLTAGWLQLGDKTIVSAANPGAMTGIAMLLNIFLLLNLILFLFNLMPLPPMDGGAILSLFLPVRWAVNYQRFMRSSPVFAIIGLVIAWNVFPLIFVPVAHFFERILFAGL